MTHDANLVSRFAARSDLHQSPMHADVMRRIGWQVAGHPGSRIFYRPLGPLAIAKLQRPRVIDLAWLNSFRTHHHTLTTYLEPGLSAQAGLTTPLPGQKLGISVEPFAHSATSLLDLSLSDSALLASFSPKTRYNITHTLRQNNLTILSTPLSTINPKLLTDFFALHASWSRQKNVIGYSPRLLTATLASYAKHSHLHLAYHNNSLVTSLLILYHDSVATYWAAFAILPGYQTFAPTLLTWTAMQVAKTRGCDIFDFGGIYDPRYPRMYKKWQGFTKFKAGFRPTPVSYPSTTLQLFW